MSSDTEQGYDVYLDDISADSSDVLAKLGQLAEQQLAAEREVEDAERALAAANAKLDDLANRQIPELMDSVGMKELKTRSGLKVIIRETIRASISGERAPEAFAWLRDHNHASLIKRVISVAFGRGEDTKAADIVAAVEALGVHPDNKESVHPQTLSAFVKEQLEEGVDVPMDLLGVFRQRVSKIELPKAKRR